MLEQGDVAEFYYLWHREAQQGEESGRKPRPVCVVIKTPGNPDIVFLFPFTSKAPLPGQLALSVPETECRRIGLTAPCWIILDEYNRVETDKDYDFVSTSRSDRSARPFSVRLLQRSGRRFARLPSRP